MLCWANHPSSVCLWHLATALHQEGENLGQRSRSKQLLVTNFYRRLVATRDWSRHLWSMNFMHLCTMHHRQRQGPRGGGVLSTNGLVECRCAFQNSQVIKSSPIPIYYYNANIHGRNQCVYLLFISYLGLKLQLAYSPYGVVQTQGDMFSLSIFDHKPNKGWGKINT